MILDADKHVLNPEVVRIWSARTLPGRVDNNREIVDNMEIDRNMVARTTFRPLMPTLR